MPLEATMMLIDNSEYMRNGDYLPTRFEAQQDAVTTVFGVKTDSNPENTVGVMTMAGKGPEVLVTHTKDLGQILGALHKSTSKLGGIADMTTAISIAQLALKHRTNKNLRQRIIVFLGSPLSSSSSSSNLTKPELVKLGKKLRKNNVAVDVISFSGDDEEVPASDENSAENLLKAFVEGANSGDNSHFISIKPGPRLLSEAILASPILAGEGAVADIAAMDAPGGGAGAGPAGNDFEFGVDPSLDPELAMALRMSMEDERVRQAAASGEGSSAAPAAQAAASSTLPPVSEVSVQSRGADIHGAETEEEERRMLEEAIALSIQPEADVEMGDAGGKHPATTADEDEEMSEEEAIARAIQMSMETDESSNNDKPGQSK